MASRSVVVMDPVRHNVPLHTVPAADGPHAASHSGTMSPALSVDEPGSRASTASFYPLKERILEARLQSISDAHQFLPADIIDQFTTREEVRTTFDEWDEEVPYDDALLDFASGPGKRSFLTLVKIEKLELLQSLLDSGFHDGNLPIGWEMKKVERRRHGGPKINRKKGLYEVGSLNEGTNTLKPQRWAAFAEWENASVEGFTHDQWLFLAPIFEKGTFQYIFHPQRPLPFVPNENAPEKATAFSRVLQVRVHDAHQQVLRLPDGTKPLVALKQLQRDKEKYFWREASTLKIISELKNHHLIQPIATYQRGESLCFMFPWAHGGNLREYWEHADGDAAPGPRRDPALVLWAVEQMCGLADGLRALAEKNGRHGDVKPENILRFTEEGGRGVLRLADLGLTRFHIEVTRNRDEPTGTKTGTFRYEPPECNTKQDEKTDEEASADDSISTITNSTSEKPEHKKVLARSRAYDVWSMGCVYLEFLVWLLDGPDALGSTNELRLFWENKRGEYFVHEVVQKSIDRMALRLGRDSALKALLLLISTRMLKVKLRDDLEPGEPAENGRAMADELLAAMRAIYERARTDEAYLFDADIWRQRGKAATGSSGANLTVPQRADQPSGSVTLAERSPEPPPSEGESEGEGTEGLEQANITISLQEAPDERLASAKVALLAPAQEQTRKLSDIWESEADNAFARSVFEKVGWANLRPPPSNPELCDDCADMDIWSPGFKRTYEVSRLRENAQACDLCRLIYQAVMKNPETADQDRVDMWREGAKSILKIGPRGVPALSLYADPGSQVKLPAYAQLGLPLLPEPGGTAQSAILNEWVRVCDESHGCLPDEAKAGANLLPTRVLDVGDAADLTIRLLDGCADKRGSYVALSHCWGKLDENQKLCTYRGNIDAHRRRIDEARLPATFRDAVHVTRALGVRHLWIDSLCIIQEDDEDWKAQSVHMEEVFSSAYCVLAASSARSSLDGFLERRPSRDRDHDHDQPQPRPCVTVDSPRYGTYYVCEAVDDFHADVEEGALNKRGWVLQERALARRSIHFSSTQVYWECGRGVHCETMAKLLNPRAAFLGDADFPRSALEFFKGGRILFFQTIYETYSRLAFTYADNRAMAVAGLEKRLLRAFETRGGHGVFECFLQRSLLWRRPDDAALARIRYSDATSASAASAAASRVPTWSWMAYDGPITYIKVPFEGALWWEDFDNPFAHQQQQQQHQQQQQGVINGGHPETSGKTPEAVDDTIISARARKLTIPRVDMLKRIVLDVPGEDVEADALRCVVIGVEKKKQDETAVRAEPTHWVLIIRLAGSEAKLPEGAYERVGVGYLLASHIVEGEPEAVRIY